MLKNKNDEIKIESIGLQSDRRPLRKMPLYNVSSKIGAAIVADINEIRFSDFK